MKLINVGFGNIVSGARVIAIVSPDSAPITRIVQESKDKGLLIAATCSAFACTISASCAEKLCQTCILVIFRETSPAP